MMKVFIDTAAWIALVNQRDDLHYPTLEASKKLRQAQSTLITTEFVLLEVADGLCNLSTRSSAINFIESLYRLPKLKIIQLDQSLYQKGWQLYKQRLDKEWSLTDCISFVVMKQEIITQAFTSDRHFEQAGFTKLL
ncbi:MAG: type II toxin-antitoxin system VapC family toxin [Microcystis sp. M144S2]|nr:type II toxin-antitoxin system VapC family toxin [Microcystis sp. M034S2]MCA2749529.1 type II toxin-antitoxin system VapC family toxin [Microcystis sp. M144S2]